MKRSILNCHGTNQKETAIKTLSIVAVTAFAFLALANFASAQGVFQLSSTTFMSNSILPIEVIFNRPRTNGTFTVNSCSPIGAPGGNQSPQLSWTNVPPRTASFAVIAFDATAGVTHWGMYNIQRRTTTLPQNAGVAGSAYGQQVVNFNDDQDYDGPCPPRNDPRGNFHDYVFTVYALGQQLELPPDANGEPANGDTLLIALTTAGPLASASITGRWSSTPSTP